MYLKLNFCNSISVIQHQHWRTFWPFLALIMGRIKAIVQSLQAAENTQGRPDKTLGVTETLLEYFRKQQRY